jgi:hypothetical protein
MHLIEQIVSGAAINTLVLGAVVGAVVTAVLHIIRRIRRLIRTATLCVAVGSLGAGGGPQILHTLLTTWR